jgi:hypothetical protein
MDQVADRRSLSPEAPVDNRPDCVGFVVYKET